MKSILLSAFLLITTAYAQDNQQLVPDTQDKQAPVTVSEPHPAIKIAEFALKSYENKFNLIAWIFGIGSGILIIIAALLAAFGIKEYKDLIKPIQKDYAKLMADFQIERDDHKTLMQKTEAAQSSITNLTYAHFAFLTTEQVEKSTNDFQRKHRLQRAKVQLEVALKNDNKLENDLVRGWIHTQYSYILRRTESKESALRFIEHAIANGLTTPGIYYNGACYLAQEDKEKAKQYLNAAIKQDFSFFMQALLDPELEEIMKDYIPPT